MERTLHLTCVRHGETSANREQLIQGQLDVPLSDTGKVQAAELGKKMSGIIFDYWFSSDLSRAYETAEIVAQHNGTSPSGIQKLPWLRERNFGVAEGLSTAKFREWARREGIPAYEFVPDDGETTADVRKRAAMYFDYLLHELLEAGGNGAASLEPESQRKRELKVIMFSHGGFLREFFAHLNSLVAFPETCMSKMNRIIPNTGVSSFTIRKIIPTAPNGSVMGGEREQAEFQVLEELGGQNYHLHLQVNSFHDDSHLGKEGIQLHI